jgi:hypothetical protein
MRAMSWGAGSMTTISSNSQNGEPPAVSLQPEADKVGVRL